MRVREPLAQRLDARAQDVGEAQQHAAARRPAPRGRIASSKRSSSRSGCSLSGRTTTWPALVDVEVAGAPPFDVVEGARGVDRPLRGGGRSRSTVCVAMAEIIDAGAPRRYRSASRRSSFRGRSPSSALCFALDEGLALHRRAPRRGRRGRRGPRASRGPLARPRPRQAPRGAVPRIRHRAHAARARTRAARSAAPAGG